MIAFAQFLTLFSLVTAAECGCMQSKSAKSLHAHAFIYLGQNARSVTMAARRGRS